MSATGTHHQVVWHKVVLFNVNVSREIGTGVVSFQKSDWRMISKQNRG